MKKRKIFDYFKTKDSEDGRKRLLCKGTIHQGQLEGGGKQCVCISVCFLAASRIPRTSLEIDNILKAGTHLFHKISQQNEYLMIADLQQKLVICGIEYSLTILDPRAGLISYTDDNPDSLAFTLESAMRFSFEETNVCFLTVGNSPGSTVGIRKDATLYTVFDSHSRDNNGRCVPDGKAVVLQFSNLSELITYVREMAGSLSQIDQQFEITPVKILLEEANSEHLETVPNSQSTDTEDLPIRNLVDKQTEPQDNSVIQTQEIPDVILQTQDVAVEQTENTSVMQTPEEPFDTFLVQSTDSQTEHAPVLQTQNVSLEQIQDEPNVSGDCSGINLPDISLCDHKANDQMKLFFIDKRIPERNFKFPSKLYKDRRKASGEIKRHCQWDWFNIFSFIGYSKLQDGIYCIACRFFPDSSHRCGKKFITEPCRNWKDAKEDLKNHAVTEYHLSSMARMRAFVDTYQVPSKRVDASLDVCAAERIKQNRKILKSITKSLIFCGRRGIALRGHRDDDTEKCNEYNHGNFKELLNFRIDSGDHILAEHFANCKKNAKYTSKTCQNELLGCIKSYIQNEIVKEINQQPFGPHFGLQCDEVTDISNWEQLGIVLRYTRDNKPVERLLEFVQCEGTSGLEICDNVIKSLSTAGIDVKCCRSQTTDGAANMSGKYNGFAAKFKEVSPKATYHYCSNHDLNLVLCKSCQVREVHVMLDALKQLGIFFHYSPKRSRRLEKAVATVNEGRPAKDAITKSKMKIFCETRWVEKITTLQDFEDLYEALLTCLDAIGFSERGWDGKAVTEAYGLMKRITDCTFIVSFQTVLHLFGYLMGLSKKLQGTEMDVIQGYDMVELVKETVKLARTSEADYNIIYAKSEKMARTADITIEIPRRCGRQTQRNNIEAEDPKTYFKRSVFIPFLDNIIQQMDMRFGTLAKAALRGFYLLPNNLNKITEETAPSLVEFHNTDLPSPSTFSQELELWKRLWSSQEDPPDTITSTLSDRRTCSTLFPNVTKILHFLQLTAVSSSGVERGNSALKYIKRASRSSMGEERLNALLLLYVCQDINIDVESVVEMYARQQPRRMLLINPLAEK